MNVLNYFHLFKKVISLNLKAPKSHLIFTIQAHFITDKLKSKDLSIYFLIMAFRACQLSTYHFANVTLYGKRAKIVQTFYIKMWRFVIGRVISIHFYNRSTIRYNCFEIVSFILVILLLPCCSFILSSFIKAC